MKNRWNAFVFALSSLLSLPMWTGCGHKETQHSEEAVFQTTSPLRTDTEVTREYVCQIRAIQHIELRALEKARSLDPKNTYTPCLLSRAVASGLSRRVAPPPSRRVAAAPSRRVA